MIIPRLLALGALAYAGLRLREGARRAVASARQAQEPVRDVLVEDPVCGKLVPSREALTLEAGGVTRHFCGEACRMACQLRAGRPDTKTRHAQGERTA